MAVVIAALLPVFLLIVLGFILKRTLIRPEAQWQGLERLTYYVLLPVFLVQTLVKADLLKKTYVLRRILNPMGTIDAIEFLLDKLRQTKSNSELTPTARKPC